MTEDALLKLYRELAANDQQTLMSFARFLRAQGNTPALQGQKKSNPEQANPVENVAAEPVKPTDIARPAQETVVAAIKRLTATYPMLDKAKLLNQTSSLVAEHVMQGKHVTEVINEMEVIFKEHYEKYAKEFQSS